MPPSRREKGRRPIKRQIGITFISIATAALTGLVAVMASVPPVSRDALAHHLLVPKLYLSHGGIYEIPQIIFSYYPMNLDLLYIIPLYFGNDIFPKYIHMFFGLLTALLLFRYLKNRLGTIYGSVGSLLFLSLPVVVRMLTVTYVDLGLTFFSTAALMFFIKWTERKFAVRDIALSAVFCGLCMGTKYNGLIILLLLTLMAVYTIGRGKRTQEHNDRPAIWHPVLFVAIAVTVFSPWAIRNVLWTGNPLYPLYQGIFNPSATSGILTGLPTPARLNHFSYREGVFGEPWWMIALIPVRIFFQGADDNPQFFDGALNPYLLLLPLLSLILWRTQSATRRHENRIWLAFSVLYIAVVFFQIDMRIRWIMPAVPPLIILSVFGLSGIVQKIKSVREVSRFKANLMAGFLFSVLLCLLSLNMRYMVDLYGRVSPMDYLRGRMTREEYITAHRPEYAVFRYANLNLPTGTTLLSFFLGGRFYYSDWPIQDGNRIFANALRSSGSTESMAATLRLNGHQYLIMNTALFNQWLANNFSNNEIEKFVRFAGQHLFLLIESREFALFVVHPD